MTVRDRRWSERTPAADAWAMLTEGWRELRQAIAGIQPVYRDITFVGPVATLTFAVSGARRPRGVSLVSLYREDTGATDAAAAAFTWTYAAGEVSTTAFSALAATTWRATFLIHGGE